MRLMDVMTAPWAIQPDMLREIRGIYETHLCGDKIDLAGVEARLGQPLQNEEQGFEVVDGVAIVPIHGVIAKRMNMFSRISGGASTQLVERDIRDAIADPSVNAIVLDIDSPGGTVDGTSELADAVFNLRGEKPIVAFANGLMASAAYYIGAAADGIYVSGEQAIVGSIGVVSTHIDVSGAEEKEGVKTTEIFAGKFKRIDSAYKPLSEAGLEYIQAGVDYMYSVFVTDVAKFRGVSVDTVLEDMADGRIFIGQQAVDAGLVDGISTLDSLIADLANGQIIGQSVAGAVVDIEKPEITINLEAETMPEKNEITFAQADIDNARAEGVTEGLEAGATTERERIQAVLKQGSALPGHEELIQGLAFDGKTTGPEAAVAILGAEQQSRAKVVQNIKSDAPEALNQPSIDSDLGQPKANTAEAFDLAIAENMDSGMSRGKAMAAAVRANPQAHQAWINKLNRSA